MPLRHRFFRARFVARAIRNANGTYDITYDDGDSHYVRLPDPNVKKLDAKVLTVAAHIEPDTTAHVAQDTAPHVEQEEQADATGVSEDLVSSGSMLVDGGSALPGALVADGEEADEGEDRRSEQEKREERATEI